MTLVAVASSDDLRLILCLESDRRAPFDVVAKPNRTLTDRPRGPFPQGILATGHRQPLRRRHGSTAPARDPRIAAATTPLIAKEWVR